MYLIFTCRGSMDLYQRLKTACGVRIPIERVRRKDKRTGKAHTAERPAIPGLVFVPQSHGHIFLASIVERDTVRPVHLQMPVPKDRVTPAHLFVPATVEPEVLVSMQKRLNDEYHSGDTSASLDELWFTVGDKVSISAGSPLEGLTGIVQKTKSDGAVRVWLDGSSALAHVSVHKRFLLPVTPPVGE